MYLADQPKRKTVPSTSALRGIKYIFPNCIKGPYQFKTIRLALINITLIQVEIHFTLSKKLKCRHIFVQIQINNLLSLSGE